MIVLIPDHCFSVYLAVIFHYSVAIMRYTAVKYDVADHWYPRNNVQKTARVDEFLNWHHYNFRKPMTDIWMDTVSGREESV